MQRDRFKRITRSIVKKIPVFAIDSHWQRAAKRKRETETYTDRIGENVVAFDAEKKKLGDPLLSISGLLTLPRVCCVIL